MSAPFDDDAMAAAIDLIGRAGAREMQVGYLHDDVPAEQAAWYAHARYRGARITEEDHRGPVEALDALARRLLAGGRCTHCHGLIALSDRGAVAYPGRMADGTVWTEEELRTARQCRWRRMGPRWVRGCAEEVPERPQPTRAERRRMARLRGRR